MEPAVVDLAGVVVPAADFFADCYVEPRSIFDVRFGPSPVTAGELSWSGSKSSSYILYTQTSTLSSYVRHHSNNNNDKCKKMTFIETVIGDIVAHLKPQKFTVLSDL